MPPQSQSKKITLKLTLPMAICGGSSSFEVEFTNKDFGKTWMQFLEVFKPEVHRQIVLQRKEYVIMDLRSPAVRKIWSLHCTVKMYINGFEKLLKKYNAIMTYPTPEMNVISPLPNASVPKASISSSRRTQGGTNTTVNRNRTSHVTSGYKRPAGIGNRNNVDSTPNKRHRSSREEEVSINVGRGATPQNNASNRRATPTVLNMNGGQYGPSRRYDEFLMDDDAASMANTVDSQESVDDLLDAGFNVNNNNARAILMANIGKYLNNVDVLRMRKEMINGINEQKWLRFNHRYPTIAGALQQILGNGFD